MRISTSMMFDTGTQNMLQLQTNLYKLQNQMSTGRRILTPADDPVAAAQALEISQRQSINSQFMDNQGNAASQLTSLESAVRGASDLILNVISRAAEADNPNMSDLARQAMRVSASCLVWQIARMVWGNMPFQDSGATPLRLPYQDRPVIARQAIKAMMGVVSYRLKAGV